MVEKGRSKRYTREVKIGGDAGVHENTRVCRDTEDSGEPRMDVGDKGFRTNQSTFGDEIESLELIRERFQLSYRKAKEVLDLVGGNVAEALAYLEEEVEQSGQYLDEALERTNDYLFGQGKELSRQFRGFWDWANNSTVTIRRGDEVMAKIPASVGIIGLTGTLFSSRLAVVGVVGLASILNSGYNLQLDTGPEHNLDH